jgi:hypothetical protein
MHGVSSATIDTTLFLLLSQALHVSIYDTDSSSISSISSDSSNSSSSSGAPKLTTRDARTLGHRCSTSSSSGRKGSTVAAVAQPAHDAAVSVQYAARCRETVLYISNRLSSTSSSHKKSRERGYCIVIRYDIHTIIIMIYLHNYVMCCLIIELAMCNSMQHVGAFSSGAVVKT